MCKCVGEVLGKYENVADIIYYVNFLHKKKIFKARKALYYTQDTIIIVLIKSSLKERFKLVVYFMCWFDLQSGYFHLLLLIHLVHVQY